MSLEKHIKTYVVTSDDGPSFPVGSQAEEISIEEILIQPVNREDEKDLYQNLYNRIYPNVKTETDFGDLSKLTNLNRRKLRQALLFRLGSGEVMQLFGLRKGVCFVCDGRLSFDNTMEPFCLKCLQKVDQYFQKLPLRQRHKNSRNSDHGFETNGSLTQRAEEEEPEAPISQEEYTQLVEELQHYKNIAKEETLSSDELSDVSLNESPAATDTTSDDIEELLALSEADATGIDDIEKRFGISEDLQKLIEASNDEPLRHYGFKRIKQRQNNPANNP